MEILVLMWWAAGNIAKASAAILQILHKAIQNCILFVWGCLWPTGDFLVTVSSCFVLLVGLNVLQAVWGLLAYPFICCVQVPFACCCWLPS